MADLRERHLNREHSYGQKQTKSSPCREELKMYHKQLNGSNFGRKQNGCIEVTTSLQHGSPESRRNYVYPSHIAPLPAFTIPHQETNGISCYKNYIYDGTHPNASDTEQAVSKISAMFPTVSDTHIRILLKKYLNREALVISALQVEKHPITTPGPYATPPPSRNINIHHGIYAKKQMTPPLSLHSSSRTGSPILRPGSGLSSGYISEYRSSPKTPHSPKMKLRYMKSIFPKADEDVILDVLCNNDNNIQKTSEVLEEMGYQRREIIKIVPKKQQKKVEDKKEEGEDNFVIPPPKMKTLMEKAQMTFRLREKYPNVQEHLITFALESVDFEEDKAHQILTMMIKEEKIKETEQAVAKEKQEKEAAQLNVPQISLSESRQSLKSLLINEQKEGSMKQSASFSRVLEETDESKSEFLSPNLQNTTGANPNYYKGPNRQLLLKNYVHCVGSDPKLKKNSNKGLAKGPNPQLISSKTYLSRGPNPELRKGPKIGLAKGSIFSQLKNMVIGESRGK